MAEHAVAPALVCQGCWLSSDACTCGRFPAYLEGALCRCRRRLVTVPRLLREITTVVDLCDKSLLCVQDKGHKGPCDGESEVGHA